MYSRRWALTALSAAVGAGGLEPAAARSRPVKLTHSMGPARTPPAIDTHFHIWAPNYLADGTVQKAIAAQGRDPRPPVIFGWTVEKALDAMDRGGVRTALTSCSFPGMDFEDSGLGRRLSRDWNEYATGLRRDHPGRFGVFAALPMADAEGSLAEIDYAFDTLRCEGVGVLTRYGQWFLDDPVYAPVLEELDRRRAVVFVHPTWAGGGCCVGTLTGRLASFVETPTDTARAITLMFFAGVFAKFPQIRWLFSHGGGTMTVVAGRIDDSQKGHAASPGSGSSETVEAQLAGFYYDTADATARPNLAALRAVTADTHILFGSDFPFSAIETTTAGLEHSGLTERGIEGIAFRNALSLFPNLSDGYFRT